MKDGYYTDDGKMIELAPIKLPTLCYQCAKHSQPDEEILCNLNRIDQPQEIKQRGEFICDAYKPKDS